MPSPYALSYCWSEYQHMLHHPTALRRTFANSRPSHCPCRLPGNPQGGGRGGAGICGCVLIWPGEPEEILCGLQGFVHVPLWFTGPNTKKNRRPCAPLRNMASDHLRCDCLAPPPFCRPGKCLSQCQPASNTFHLRNNIL